MSKNQLFSVVEKVVEHGNIVVLDKKKNNYRIKQTFVNNNDIFHEQRFSLRFRFDAQNLMCVI